jgi:hypothetical protein
MKKITKKNKIKINGSWNSYGLEVYWHPKSDYIFSMLSSGVLTPLGPFGKLATPLEIKIDKKGNANLGKISGFDMSILKIKLKRYGFKKYTVINTTKKSSIIFNSPDECAMFQVYFSEFII